MSKGDSKIEREEALARGMYAALVKSCRESGASPTTLLALAAMIQGAESFSTGRSLDEVTGDVRALAAGYLVTTGPRPGPTGKS